MRRTLRIVVTTGIVITLASLVFLVAALGPSRGGSERSSSVPSAATARDLAGVTANPSGVAGTIDALRARLDSFPEDWRSQASLGLAYVRQAQLTADPSNYGLAETALEASLGIRPDDNAEALVGLAALAAARHEFGDALRYGTQARALAPLDASVYGVVGDAQLELGRYQSAIRSFQQMVDLEPGLASYARVSYARQLIGDLRGAAIAMRTARDLASTGADVAWTSYRVGELAFAMGDTGEAAKAYRLGLSADPAYEPNLAGLGLVAWARGDLGRAIELYDEVVSRYPSPEYVVTLGDLALAQGDRALARDQFALVRAELRLFEANGVNADLELALYLADHGRPGDALRAARSEWRRRRSVHVADALAWALHANGRDAAAAGYARRALALGGRPPLFLYHAGMIQLALGHRDAARDLLSEALDVDPYFSVRHAPKARAALGSLTSA
jgi:tetratricopeptide (TPR) repeat protein